MMFSLTNIGLVAAGGMSGSVLRYLISAAMVHRLGTHFPWATLLVNIAGSLFIGLISGVASRHSSFQSWQLLLATGFCGGFTTFSALSNEALYMLKQQQYGWLALFLVASLLLGIGAAALGYTITK